MTPCGIDDIGQDYQIVLYKFRWVALVGEYATYLCSGEKYVVWTRCGKEPLDIALSGQIELASGTHHEILESRAARPLSPQQPSPSRRPRNQPPVSILT